jgi:hypothetical protein
MLADERSRTARAAISCMRLASPKAWPRLSPAPAKGGALLLRCGILVEPARLTRTAGAPCGCSDFLIVLSRRSAVRACPAHPGSRVHTDLSVGADREPCRYGGPAVCSIFLRALARNSRACERLSVHRIHRLRAPAHIPGLFSQQACSARRRRRRPGPNVLARTFPLAVIVYALKNSRG